MNVSWYVRDETIANVVNSTGSNPRYLSSVRLDRSLISATTLPAEAFRDSGMVIFAVPSAYLKETVKKINKELMKDIAIAVSIKSFVPGSSSTPSHFIGKHFQRDSCDIMVLGGPCHAEEIATDKDTFLTIAGDNQLLVQALIDHLSCPYIKTVASNDPLGIEYASILKNIIAIATGMAAGLLYGENFQSVLVSNAMQEVSRFIESVAPGARNFYRSAYFGDLLVTAYSDFSRNRMLGKLIGRGLAANKAIQTMEMVAEGFYASKELAPLLKKTSLHTPVLNAVYRILHQHANPFSEFRLLKEQLQ
jgi:glycerol-3-phosphate dehydrogenase (NAD(P)+)